MRTLYLCSIVSFIIISVTDIVSWLSNFFFRNEFLFEVVAKIFSPGSVLAALLVKPMVFDEPNLMFIVLAELFYTLVLFGVVAIVSYVKEKCLYRKAA